MNSSINQTPGSHDSYKHRDAHPISVCFCLAALFARLSLAIIIGVVVGTYSSIFIASPLSSVDSPARGAPPCGAKSRKKPPRPIPPLGTGKGQGAARTASP